MIYGKTVEETYRLVKAGKAKISIIGAGHMGLPLAVLFANAGARVVAVRPDEPAVDMVNKGVSPVRDEPGIPILLKKAVEEGRLSATIDTTKAVGTSAIIIILVPLLLDKDNSPDYRIIKEVGSKIGA
ncbi:MAG: 3-hydroxyacyl-CoA dehydrogenase NAD-binding domain-containing protein, partial [Candidatus Ranarchaeia archaeon]